MLGFDDGKQRERVLDGKPVTIIDANLSAVADVTLSRSSVIHCGDAEVTGHLRGTAKPLNRRGTSPADPGQGGRVSKSGTDPNGA